MVQRMETDPRMEPVERAKGRAWDEWPRSMDSIDATNPRRITWWTKADDGSSIVVTSEPQRHGTASIVATRIGIAALETNERAWERWTATSGTSWRPRSGARPSRPPRRRWAEEVRHAG